MLAQAILLAFAAIGTACAPDAEFSNQNAAQHSADLVAARPARERLAELSASGSCSWRTTGRCLVLAGKLGDALPFAKSDACEAVLSLTGQRSRRAEGKGGLELALVVSKIDGGGKIKASGSYHQLSPDWVARRGYEIDAVVMSLQGEVQPLKAEVSRDGTLASKRVEFAFVGCRNET